MQIFAIILGLSFSLNTHASTTSKELADCIVRTSGENTPVFHNAELAGILKSSKPSKAEIRETILTLIRKGAFDIPVDQSGFVPAANVGNHGGNYGNYIWLRDMARVYQGLSSYLWLLQEIGKASHEFKNLEAETRSKVARLAKAMARVADSPQWAHAMFAAIKNPNIVNDENEGFKNVIWVRRLLKPFLENREPNGDELNEESKWTHKQNDGVAEFAIAIFDAVSRGHISYQEISDRAKLNIQLLPTYFTSIQFWQMWDAGAWEETMALHASSLGIVVKLLERFQTTGGFSDVVIPADVLPIAQKSMGDLGQTIGKAYAVLNRQLLAGRITESRIGAPFSRHFEDAAIFHLSWGFPSRFTLEDRLRILDGLDVLRRPSGYIRYAGDLFLYGASEAAKNRDKVPFYKLQAVPKSGGYVTAGNAEIEKIISLHEQHMTDKNSRPVLLAAGRRLEAQWTFFDSMAGVENARLFQETGDPRFYEDAVEHFRRMCGLATGEGMVTSEGKAVEPYKFPEAYIPVRILVRGVPQIVYVVSPNSPLNWSTAEAAILALKMWEMTQ